MIEIRIEHGLVSLSVAARMLDVTRQRVHQLCQNGDLDGAAKMECSNGRSVWVIPRQPVEARRDNHKRYAKK